MIRDAIAEAAPRVLASITRRFRDFAAAEDAVQEALLAAHVEWPERGVPDNPAGWLYRVACRRMADRAASEAARRRREVAAARPEGEEPPMPDEEGDETLTLLYLCCHPSLAPGAAVALTLRAVGGLTTAEIARAFLVPEATMGQRISRAKRTIAESGAPFALPDADERPRRTALVMHALYVMFDEGYLSTSGPLLRADLTREAIRLARILHLEEPAAAGLLALFLLTDARHHARCGPDGELIPLHEQDRNLWNREAIEEGKTLVEGAFAAGVPDVYAVQAAIAALHDEAPSIQGTDWPQILALYGVLLRMTDNPVVALNRVVAAAMVHGPETALAWLAELGEDARLARGHRLPAVRAHLLEMLGDPEAAAKTYRAAAAATASPPERRYLLKKAARLESTCS